MKNAIMKRTWARTASCLALSVGVLCAESAFASEYDYIQLHALQAEYEDLGDFTLRGAELRGGFSLGRVFTEFRYRDLSDKSHSRDLDEDRWTISLGYAIPYSDKTHFDLRLNYHELDLDGTRAQGDLRGDLKYYGVSSYVHHELTQNVRVYAGLEWQNWDRGSNQNAYHLGAMFKFDVFSLGAEFTKYSESDAISLFLRYPF